MPTQIPAPGTDRATWHKARASSGTGGCVEVADFGDLVAVRDSKDLQRPPHLYPRNAWRDFTSRLRALGAVPFTTGQIQVTITADGTIALHDLIHHMAPHHYTAFEWDCFLDGVRSLEPELACA
ncbi:DUF397 domain-containing protein (plasmid) [Kitasatospora sp. NBC_00070]|uniref:DUF397 domain-containing protein n=1 Tax=Kitasatospora sp. NBC_00070 TaxID=2975962 RepID=UPI002F908CB5